MPLTINEFKAAVEEETDDYIFNLGKPTELTSHEMMLQFAKRIITLTADMMVGEKQVAKDAIGWEYDDFREAADTSSDYEALGHFNGYNSRISEARALAEELKLIK